MPRKKKEHLKKRKDGRYCCKYKGLAFYSYVSDAEAIALRDEYIANESKGFQRQTVSEYALPWLKRAFPSVADSTYTGLAIHLQHLIDEIGNRMISDIVPSDIKGIYSNHYRDLSASYINSAKQLYCALFDSAVADGLCRSNPAREKAAKPHKGTRTKERVLSDLERQYIETLCTDHRAWPAVMVMLYAGLRPQEAKALDIDRDVDFINDIITVRETAHIDTENRQKYAFSAEGKTEWSNRQIPLFKPLKDVLTGRHGYLITSAHGERVTIQTFKTAWQSYIYCMETAINGISKRWYGKTKEQKALAEKGQLPEWIPFTVTPYTLRHAFCEMCISAGVEPNTCRHWMGHADTQMIMKVYDSVSDNRSENERKKVESGLFRVQNEVQPESAEAESIEK